ncbi:MAG: response regulator [Gemmatimonadetes bacterium]|nr:response regulator [Gemmatimonadota bacterium]
MMAKESALAGAHHGPGGSARELSRRREWIVRVLLGSLVGVGLVAYIPSVWVSARLGLWGLIAFNTLVYGTLVAAFLRRGLGYRTRAWVLVGVAYFLGVIHILLFGAESAGPLWLGAVPVLVAILFERRATLWSLGATAATLVGTALLEILGVIHWPSPPAALALFAIISGSLMMVAAGLSLAVNALIRGLRQSAERAERLAAELTRERGLLEEANLRLRREMEEREAAEARLRQAEKLTALGTLAGGIAHNLNNLLTPLLIGVELLREGGMEEAGARAEVLDRMQHAAMGARDVVRQVLTFSRALPEAHEPIDAAGVFGDTARLLHASLPAGVELAVELDPAAGSIALAAADAQQILLNLGSNAIHAMPDGGRLAVTLGVERGPAPELDPAAAYVCLTVRDSGVGMDEATRLRAVEPFFTTKPPGRGTGLGLATVHGMVRAAGGALTLESAPGAGTTVRVYLPRVAQAAPHAPGAEAPSPGTRAHHVLVVDDDPGVRTVATTLLRRMGCRVSVAANGEEALACLGEGGDLPDLLLTDLNMPGRSGLSLFREARRRFPEMAVVLMSGFMDEESQQRAGEIGTSGIIAKPFRMAELRGAIDDALRGVGDRS